MLPWRGARGAHRVIWICPPRIGVLGGAPHHMDDLLGVSEGAPLDTDCPQGVFGGAPPDKECPPVFGRGEAVADDC